MALLTGFTDCAASFVTAHCDGIRWYSLASISFLHSSVNKVNVVLNSITPFHKIKRSGFIKQILTFHENCIFLAKALASELTQRVEGTSAFFFGWADTPQRRGLAQRRKEMGWFKKDPNMTSVQADLGPPPQKRFGLTG